MSMFTEIVSASRHDDHPLFMLFYSLVVVCMLIAFVLWDRRYRRKWHEFLAKDWPQVEGVFVTGEGEIVILRWGGSKKIAGYECRLYYEYQSSGEQYGIYARSFPTKPEAETFLRLLDGKEVCVRAKPGSPSRSNISDRDIDVLLANHAGGSALA